MEITKIYDEEWQGTVLGSDDTHRYIWVWFGYNLRLLAVPHHGFGYDHGWCYRRNPQALEDAVAAWDPDTQDEPDGWHKRATHPPRRAPHHDPARHVPRCVHGTYAADTCRALNCEGPTR